VSDNDSDAAEAEVVERRVVFISDDREASTQHLRSLTDAASELHFLVRHSTQFAQNDKVLFARMFSHLFPFGRGHPGEDHHVPVSMDACLRHYAELSTRKFAEDDLFTVVSFDHLTVQKLFTSVAVMCQRDPCRFATYSDVTEQALLNALKTKELRRQHRTSSARGGGSDTGGNATDTLNTVELSGSTMWGSDAERGQCHRRALAYQARFGQPAVFVTLTPDIADSLVMAQYCGILSVDTLFDASLAEPPGKSALHSASMRNDVPLPGSSRAIFTRSSSTLLEFHRSI
jgi:hypothetical protein